MGNAILLIYLAFGVGFTATSLSALIREIIKRKEHLAIGTIIALAFAITMGVWLWPLFVFFGGTIDDSTNGR